PHRLKVSEGSLVSILFLAGFADFLVLGSRFDGLELLVNKLLGISLLELVLRLGGVEFRNEGLDPRLNLYKNAGVDARVIEETPTNLPGLPGPRVHHFYKIVTHHYLVYHTSAH